MSERMESVTCGKCGNEALGRFDAAFLIKLGYRQVDGKWVCHLCTGLFAANLPDETWEWLADKVEPPTGLEGEP